MSEQGKRIYQRRGGPKIHDNEKTSGGWRGEGAVNKGRNDATIGIPANFSCLSTPGLTASMIYNSACMRSARRNKRNRTRVLEFRRIQTINDRAQQRDNKNDPFFDRH